MPYYDNKSFFSRLIEAYCNSIKTNLKNFLFYANKFNLTKDELTTQNIINKLYDMVKENNQSAQNILELKHQGIYDLEGTGLCSVDPPIKRELTEEEMKILTIFAQFYPFSHDKTENKVSKNEIEFYNSYYFRKYLQNDKTIAIIDEILKLKLENKKRKNFLPNAPEIFLISECLSLGIRQLKESQNYTFKDMGLIFNKSPSFINDLINCRAAKDNYNYEGLRQLLVSMLCNNTCTFDYIIYISNERDQTACGCTTPMIIVESEQPIIAENLKCYFSLHPEEIDIASNFLKILESNDKNKYINNIRKEFESYCYEIDFKDAQKK